MARNREVPELLERFMEESGASERWITVYEFRAHFKLNEQYSPAISGFLQRIYQGSFYSCPYRVERIEKISIETPQKRTIRRYLIRRRPGSAAFSDDPPYPERVPEQGPGNDGCGHKRRGRESNLREMAAMPAHSQPGDA